MMRVSTYCKLWLRGKSTSGAFGGRQGLYFEEVEAGTMVQKHPRASVPVMPAHGSSNEVLLQSAWQRRLSQSATNSSLHK